MSEHLSALIPPRRRWGDGWVITVPILAALTGWAFHRYGIPGLLGAAHVLAALEAARVRLTRKLYFWNLDKHVRHIAIPEFSPYAALTDTERLDEAPPHLYPAELGRVAARRSREHSSELTNLDTL